MKTDLSRFNINYYNHCGKCDLSIELIGLKHLNFLDLVESVWTLIRNHHTYINKQVINYNTIPSGCISSLKHFLDISGYDYRGDKKLQKDLNEIGSSMFFENYIHISDYTRKLRTLFIKQYKDRESKMEGIIDNNYNYEHDVDGIVDEGMKSNYNDIVYLNNNIFKVLNNGDAMIININILDDDIDKSLARQDRSLDIHYNTGVACLNAFIKTENEIDITSNEVLDLNTSKYDNYKPFDIIRFMDVDKQNKMYTIDTNIKTNYYGLVIPLKSTDNIKEILETIFVNIVTDAFYINSKDGIFYYHDENITTSSNNIWEKIINE